MRAALAWLREQPGGRVSARPGELGRRWNWHHRRVSGKLNAWARDGIIKHRRNTITVLDQKPSGKIVANEVSAPSDRGQSLMKSLVLPERDEASIPALIARYGPDYNKPSNTAPDHVRGANAYAPSGVVIASYIAALSLAGVSAFFSITGLTAIFIGAFWPVIAMGVVLEIGKLTAVAWLGHHGCVTSWRLRTALTVLVAVLMGLSAIGAYGFLAKAHIGHAIEVDVAGVGRAADVDARLDAQRSLLTDIDRRIGQIDGAIETATRKGRTGSAMRLADDQRKTRLDLGAQRTTQAKALVALQVEKAGVDGERKVAEADLGPVRYLATLLGAKDDDVLRWFILIVALLLDPAAVLLLLAAATMRT